MTRAQKDLSVLLLTNVSFIVSVLSVGLRLRKRQVKIEYRNLRGQKIRQICAFIEGCRSARGFPVTVKRVYKLEVSWFS